jgi:hypothetical protein
MKKCAWGTLINFTKCRILLVVSEFLLSHTQELVDSPWAILQFACSVKMKTMLLTLFHLSHPTPIMGHTQIRYPTVESCKTTGNGILYVQLEKQSPLGMCWSIDQAQRRCKWVPCHDIEHQCPCHSAELCTSQSLQSSRVSYPVYQ